jgi:hypothetical protein
MTPSLRTLGVTALLALLAVPAQAQERQRDDDRDRRVERVADRDRRDGDRDRRYERDFQIDRRNAKTYRLNQIVVARDGERFRVRGDLRVAAQVERDRDGGLHVTALADPDGLTVTRLENGQAYVVRGSEEVSRTYREPNRGNARVSTTVDFLLVPTGRETPATRESLRLFLTLSGDVDRSGNLEGRITDLRIQ